MADVNLVNLERVGFGLRNFDMAIVPKVRTELLHVAYLACSQLSESAPPASRTQL